MKRVVFLWCLLGLAVSVCAQEARRQADEMARRADNFTKKAVNRSVTDSFTVYRAVMDAVSYSLKSDDYDRAALQAGQSKLRHETDNRKRLQLFIERLIPIGLSLNQMHSRDEALDALRLYLKAAESPLLKGEEHHPGIAAYHAAHIFLDSRSYQLADNYADVALHYDESALLGAEIKAQCMGAQMVTHEDSAKYLAVINKLYETNPNNEKYFAWIMRFFDRPAQRRNLEYFVDKELENNPNSIVPWILKGEIAMKARRWDEAADAYQHADEIDPSSVPVAYNIGVCLNYKALEIQEQARAQGGMTAEDERQLKQLLSQSRTYLERVRSRDPRRKKVDWVKPLYMVYQILGDKIKAEELEPLVSGFKNNY